MMWVEIWLTSQSPYDIQKTSQKYLLQILQICNKLFPNLFAIAICNKRNLIALQFICNKPVIYWTRSGPHIWSLDEVLWIFFWVSATNEVFLTPNHIQHCISSQLCLWNPPIQFQNLTWKINSWFYTNNSRIIL